MDVVSNANFWLSNNNKDQLKELYKDLNEKLINAINTLDASTLAGNLTMIKNHQLDYLSIAVIPPETVDNGQEHLAAIRCSITL